MLSAAYGVHGILVLPPLTTACEGDKVTLKCLYLKSEDEDVSWYWYCLATKTGAYLSNRGILLEGLDVTKYGLTDNGTRSLLDIHNVTSEDAGNFTCKTADDNIHSTALLIVGKSLFLFSDCTCGELLQDRRKA